MTFGGTSSGAPASGSRVDGNESLTAAVIVAHPDDETLWAGGMILAHRQWRWFVAALCRASDPNRAPRFYRALERLGATGAMADLDDGSTQPPLDEANMQQAVLSLLPQRHFDLLLTHGPAGEYTRHRRHEETSRAVVALWKEGTISAGALWLFAYEDGGRRYPPRADERADLRQVLSQDLWNEKYCIITEVYGFAADSWEARTTPREEAFFQRKRQ